MVVVSVRMGNRIAEVGFERSYLVLSLMILMSWLGLLKNASER